MEILRFSHNNAIHTGILTSKGIVPVEEINTRRGTKVPRELLEIIRTQTAPQLAEVGDLPGIPLSEVKPVLPYDVPPKIWCIGLNYHSHAVDINAVQPEEPGSFMKPASCMFPPNGEIVLPPPHLS